MAARLGMEVEAFSATYLRTVADPRDGRLRLSLQERDGRCALLEGSRHCRVYLERPAHCADFPFWQGVLTDPAAFERARAVCPGIAVEASPELRRQAFSRLAALYAQVDARIEALAPRCELSGLCCRFEQAGHELFATALEADFAIEHGPALAQPEAPGRCHYHQQGRCTNREGRALGCRTYFCDEDQTQALEDLHAGFLGQVRALERELGYPAAYGRFPAQLEARGKTKPDAASEGSP
jgi:Fe-S-cluster containining protein